MTFTVLKLFVSRTFLVVKKRPHRASEVKKEASMQLASFNQLQSLGRLSMTDISVSFVRFCLGLVVNLNCPLQPPHSFRDLTQ